MDEEILQDFLVEATELLDQLNEQLVDLENSPDDSNLLNTIFRGFHTVKGGAGFLGVNPLVQVCHRAENVFDKIRNQDIAYDADVADVILRAFDQVSRIVGELNDGIREFDDIDPVLLAQLDAIVKGTSVPVDEPDDTTGASDEAPVVLQLPEGVDPDGEISDDEFEALLNQRDMLLGEHTLNEETPVLTLPEGVDPDGEISDDEFEALLNQRDMLLGEVSMPADDPPPAPKEHVVAVPKPAPAKPAPSVKPESTPPAAASKAAGEATVRVDTRHLDAIMNLVGELVLVRNRLLTLRSADATQEDIANAVGNLDHVTTDLQASVMKTRMQPVKKVFGRFPRVVRDLARKLGKDIELELVGEETDLDKGLVEALADPLVHLVRNSVDHGIEMPDVRADQGKARVGRIVLAAEQEGDHILLSITDDGKGMDPDVLRRKAVEKGMMDEATANQLEDKQAFMLIMGAGFSTAEQVSDLSGRGVGMDVVKNMITKLNGSIDIDSAVGEGTRIRIRVPLTLAILPTLMVSFAKDSYAIPLTSVQEIFDFEEANTNTIDGQTMVRLRKKSVPLFFLSDWLTPGVYRDNRKGDKVVIVSIGNQRVGLVVEQVNGQEEVVIKPLGVMLQKIQGYAGATITGNGSIALILDLPGLIERFQ
ncbi:chemotaxis protein CheA [Thiomicrospira microaerophila]|uniref:chemotaxis protein CheA n=1 Tax=Thiomicrospira microaerophila TaxID=406020 RepID=UPI0005CAA692|nr:chemotaxis protein CheA [Thiomicrospira microaerophila]